MKFLAAITLLVAAGVTAQDKNCEAEYIVSRCLKTETDKVGACATTDFDCLCAAYQAVSTCYNNCPNDDRAPAARSQVAANCRNVTTTTSTRLATAAASSTGGASSSAGIATNLNAPPPTSAGFVSGSATPTGGSSAGAVHKVGSGLAALAAGLVGAALAML